MSPDFRPQISRKVEELIASPISQMILPKQSDSKSFNRWNLVYQLKGRLSGTAQSERMLAQHPRAASAMCDLTTCYIKTMYLPDLSMPELQDFNNKVRTTADMPRTMTIQSRHVLVIQGTSEQVALAERLSSSTSAPQ